MNTFETTLRKPRSSKSYSMIQYYLELFQQNEWSGFLLVNMPSPEAHFNNLMNSFSNNTFNPLELQIPKKNENAENRTPRKLKKKIKQQLKKEGISYEDYKAGKKYSRIFKEASKGQIVDIISFMPPETPRNS